MATLVGIELTKKLPAEALAGATYRVEGKAKLFGALGAPPFVYLKSQFKEWWKPDVIESVDYSRGWPVPILGNFSVNFKPEKEGDYDVSVIATPAVLSLPVVGMVPTLFETEAMKVSVSKEAIDFTLTKPAASPTQVGAGEKVTITCPVTSNCDETKTITAKVKIYEGSALSGHGTLIATKTSSPFSIAPGESHNIIVEQTAVAGTIDRRDVGIEIYIGEAKVKDDEWDDVYYVTGEAIDFSLTRPSVSPSQIKAGTALTITCPITSKCTKTQNVTVKVLIYEGSALATHGTLITTKTSSPFNIGPGESYNVTVNHTAVAGTIDRRDIGVEVYVGGTKVKDDEWDDVYYVTAETVDFNLTRPTASPSQVDAGGTVTITCPVTSQCESAKNVTAKVLIYEGSALATHGTLLETKSISFSISPGETHNVVVTRTAVAGTIDRRDIGVEIYVGGTKVKDDEWDDVYYVTSETIDFTLTRPAASPAQASVGQTVTITCPVTSKCVKTQSVTAKVLIYEGSALSGHGALLETKSINFSIASGATYNVIVYRTAIAGTIDRRDIGVELYVGGTMVKNDEWDDIYSVTPDVVDFSLFRPTASPSQVNSGATVTITCPLISNCSKTQSVTARVKIYEGSALATHGTLLDTKSITFSISPGESHNVIVTRTAVAGTIDRRDIGVELYVGGTMVKNDEWDDVYYVSSAPPQANIQISRPTPSPSQVIAGQQVTITVPVSSSSGSTVTVQVKCLIYEGSFWSGHGTLLWQLTKNVTIYPGQTANVQFVQTTTQGSIDRRDVGVQVLYNGQVVAEDEWDDLYYVVAGAVTTITAYFSGGVVHFDYSGFQPGATVTLTILETGGWLTSQANSSGAGSGNFYDNDPPGTYNLRAQDGYGHSATATFPIS